MKNEKGGGNMIQPLNANSKITFKANDDAFKQFKQPTITKQNITEEQPKQDEIQISQADKTIEGAKKETITDKYNRIKTRCLNFFKGMNNITKTSSGAIQGIASGAVTTAVVGVIGKNAKEANGKIIGTTVGIGKDILKGACKAICFVPSLITKSPLENAKNLITAPKKFYTNYLNVTGKMVKETAEGASEALKTHKVTAAIATVVGVGVAAVGFIKGKINANEANAELDHKVNHGHIK